jgi:hypothetical protein
MKEFADLVIEEGAPFNYKWYARQLRHVSCVVCTVVCVLRVVGAVVWRILVVSLHSLCVRCVLGCVLYAVYCGKVRGK